MGTRVLVAIAFAGTVALGPAHATLVSIEDCIGAVGCVITPTPPNPVQRNPNDGLLLAWDERQNVTLVSDLRVDRVFDESAPFIGDAGGGDFFIRAGTVVSSHYLQWDPGAGSSATVRATVVLDSQVFAFITADANLFASDPVLGRAGLDYNDFGLRGLEPSDVTTFIGPNTAVEWRASSPGDWTRLITAFSPGGAQVREPESAWLIGLAMGVLGVARLRRRQSTRYRAG